MSNTELTPASEVNQAPETTANDGQESAGAEPTVAELHPVKTEKKVDTVPMARLNKEIQRRKELEQELASLRESNDTPSANESDSDEPDVRQLAEELKQIKDGERARALEVTFERNFQKALENSPEYKDIVNPAVIKRMAFDPANANKTYRQLLEEAYGNALTGRRTIETTTPRGGAKDTKLDIERARNDSSYRHEVLADPELRKQYNEGLTDRVFR
jgi:hypothetical protein